MIETLSIGAAARICAADLFAPEAAEPEDITRIEAAIASVAEPLQEAERETKAACDHLSFLVVELSNQLSDAAGGYQVKWRSIETAPRNGELIWVYCPPAHGLGELVSVCCWHVDAGFCVDELRTPTLWFPILQPDAPKASE